MLTIINIIFKVLHLVLLDKYNFVIPKIRMTLIGMLSPFLKLENIDTYKVHLSYKMPR